MSFDEKAAEWDSSPRRRALAKKVSNQIEKVFKENPQVKNAMEYGCGTGLVSRALAPLLDKITAVDSSRGMLEELEKKLSSEGIGNIFPRYLNLEQDGNFNESFDAIYTSMVMHHVKDTQKVFQRFQECLAKNGLLIIVDLNEEDGSFHGEDFSGHHGFNTDELIYLAQKTGFEVEENKELTRMVKGEPGQEKEFSIFFMVLKKS